MTAPVITRQIFLTRQTAAFWRVTFNHPPLNIFGPESISQLSEVVTAIETDEHVKVVVFDSGVEGVFLNHDDFLAKTEDSPYLPPGQIGLQQLPDALVRLSRAPVVSICSIRGHTTGIGSELALASDMRFASREKAILSHWEVCAGLVPGGGPMARLPRLIGRGRALEMLLGADDLSGDLAELYGFVNRALPTANWIRLLTHSRRVSRPSPSKRLRNQAAGRLEQPSTGCRNRARVGRIPGLGRTSRGTAKAPHASGARPPKAGSCRKPSAIPRRTIGDALTLRFAP